MVGGLTKKMTRAIIKRCAGLSELADETDSKSVVGDRVWVRVPQPACFQVPENHCLCGSSGFLFFYTIQK